MSWKYRSIGGKENRYYDKTYVKRKEAPILLSSGYYNTQGYACLKQCWTGFRISKVKGNHEKMIWYAKGIQRVEKELGLDVSSFPNLELAATSEKEEEQQITNKESNHSSHA